MAPSSANCTADRPSRPSSATSRQTAISRATTSRDCAAVGRKPRRPSQRRPHRCRLQLPTGPQVAEGPLAQNYRRPPGLPHAKISRRSRLLTADYFASYTLFPFRPMSSVCGVTQRIFAARSAASQGVRCSSVTPPAKKVLLAKRPSASVSMTVRRRLRSSPSSRLMMVRRILFPSSPAINKPIEAFTGRRQCAKFHVPRGSAGPSRPLRHLTHSVLCCSSRSRYAP